MYDQARHSIRLAWLLAWLMHLSKFPFLVIRCCLFEFCNGAVITHWAFIMAICFWGATFSYKSYHLSDFYRLYISCKNNIGKALNYQTDLSDWYQLYINCKINIEISITLSTRYETIRSINYKTDDGYSCNHAEWVFTGGRGMVVDANPKIARTQNLPPPLDNSTLHFCPPPLKAMHWNFAPLMMYQQCISLKIS